RASGSISGKRTGISLRFSLGQSYTLELDPPRIPFASSSIDYSFHKGACNPFNDAEHTDTHAGWGNAGGELVKASGFSDRLEADVLDGSDPREDRIAGMPTVITVKWSLRRMVTP